MDGVYGVQHTQFSKRVLAGHVNEYTVSDYRSSVRV